MTIALETLTITDASRKLSHGEFSARELTESYLSRIERENAGLNAYLEVFDDCAEQASRIDERRAKGEALGSLAGVNKYFGYSWAPAAYRHSHRGQGQYLD